MGAMPAGPPITLCGSLSRRASKLGARMHNSGYAALGLAYTYVPFETQDLAGALRGMRALGIRGFGIAFGFKEEVIAHLDALDPLAAAIGAVNTVVNEGGRLIGHNTDAEGARRALEEVMPVSGRSVVLIGAGGAARAVAQGLRSAGARLHVANRTPARAAALVAHLDAVGLPGPPATAGGLEDLGSLRAFDALVNCSVAGMEGASLASPVPAADLHPELVVMDIVYKPLETELVSAARRRGCTAIHGGRMLLHQACRQFELYTGVPAPTAAMAAALDAGIAEQARG
jgi:shikimate dehydrogenase